jgi:hypothetical protein
LHQIKSQLIAAASNSASTYPRIRPTADMPAPTILDDPEKGTMQIVSPEAVATSLAKVRPTSQISSADFKVNETTLHQIKSQLIAAASQKQKPPPPKKVQRKVSRFIRFSLWFNTYRKFFVFTVTINLIGLILAATNVWTYPRHYTGGFLLGNLLTAILVRNELFGRFLYLIVNTLFAKWSPLWFRLGCTSVLQHLGGIHSGCATSGLGWLIFKVTLIFIDYKNNHDAVLAMGVITNVLVAISIASAFPWVRNTHHNVFERHHRFIGWLGLLSTWVFVVLGDSYDLHTHSWNPNGLHIIRQQDFWFTFGMTVFILIPWFTVRKVKVDVEIVRPSI